MEVYYEIAGIIGICVVAGFSYIFYEVRRQVIADRNG